MLENGRWDLTPRLKGSYFRSSRMLRGRRLVVTDVSGNFGTIFKGQTVQQERLNVPWKWYR